MNESYSDVPSLAGEGRGGEGWPTPNITTFIKGAIYGGFYGLRVSTSRCLRTSPWPPKKKRLAVNNSNAWHPEKFFAREADSHRRRVFAGVFDVVPVNFKPAPQLA